MDTIKVGIRVRPLLKREQEKGCQWSATENCIVQTGSSNPYYFDYVFGMLSNNNQIYVALVQPIVLSVMEGFNGTIFAYGQTSSGKTHTMMGDASDFGIIPLSVSEIFNFIDKHPDREFLINASYFEIYNESLTDLLDHDNKSLKIREDSQHNVKVLGITEQRVETPEEIGSLLSYGQRFRSVGETLLNERSSRSHTIFTLTIESRLKRESSETQLPKEDGIVKVGILNLVDLAGSERVSTTGNEGIRFKEGTYINLSLLGLGNVISKLSEGGSSHIPFRDSKLTRILQSSLGGNAKTCIICTITPAEIGESHSTLKFASRAMTIKNKPIVNEVLVGEEALLKKLKEMETENKKLREKLAEGLPMQEQQQLTQQLAKTEEEKGLLESQLKALETIINKKSSLKVYPNNRRKTVCCHGLLAPSSKSPAPPLATSVTKKVKFSCPPSPFVSAFDRPSFERHLQSIQDCLSPDNPCSKPLTLKGRASFIPELMRASIESKDSTGCLDSPPMLLDDQSIQKPPPKRLKLSTDSGIDLASTSVATQTDPLSPPTTVSRDLQTNPPTSLPPPSPHTCSSLNNSFCVHKKQAAEKISTMQFEADEWRVMIEELQQQLILSERKDELIIAESKIAILENERANMEMDNQAQGELLLELQARLKEANGKVQRLQEKVSISEALNEEKHRLEKTTEMSSSEVKEQLGERGYCQVQNSTATVAMELEQAKERIQILTLERDKLLRNQDNLMLDQKQYCSLLRELEEANAKVEEASILKKKLADATDMVDVQASELERIKLELSEALINTNTSHGGTDDNFAEEVIYKPVSLEEEIAQVSQQTPKNLIKEETSSEVEKLREELRTVTDELAFSKSQLEELNHNWKHSQDECDMMSLELADLRKQLVLLHQKLQVTTPSKRSATLIIQPPATPIDADSQPTTPPDLTPMKGDLQLTATPELLLHWKKVEDELLMKIQEIKVMQKDKEDLAAQLNQLMKTEEEVRVMKKDKADLAAQLKGVEDDLAIERQCKIESEDKLKNQLMKTEEEVRVMKKDKEDLAAQLKAVEDDLAGEDILKNQLMKTEEVVRVMKKNKEDLAAQLKEVEDDLAGEDKLKNQLMKTEEEVRVMKKDKEDLAAQLKEVKDGEDKLKNQLIKTEEEVKKDKEDLAAQLKEVEDDLARERQCKSESEDKLRDQSVKSEEELRAIKKEKENIAAQLKMVEEDLKAAVDKTLDEAQLRGQLLKELKILKEEYEEVKSSYARIQDECNEPILELQHQLSKVKKELTASSEINEELRSRLDKLSSDVLESTQTHDCTVLELREQLVKFEEEVKFLKEDKRRLVLKCKKAEDDMLSAEWNEKESEDKADQLETELKEVREAYEKACVQIEQYSCDKEQLLQLKQELSQVKDQLTMSKDENRELQSKLDMFQTDSSTHDNTVLELREQLVKFEEEVKSLKEDKRRLKLRYKKAEDDMLHAEWCEKESEDKADRLEEELKEACDTYEKVKNELSLQYAKFEEELQKAKLCEKEKVDQLEKELKEVREAYEEATSKTGQPEHKRTSQSQLMSEVHELRDTISAIRRDNARLTKKIQGMATVPKVCDDPVVDGSGMVTGLVYYKLQRELSAVSSEKEQCREEMKKIRHERNLFRTKYFGVKETCSCGAVDRIKTDLMQSSSASSSQELPSKQDCLSTTHSTSSSVSARPSIQSQPPVTKQSSMAYKKDKAYNSNSLAHQNITQRPPLSLTSKAPSEKKQSILTYKLPPSVVKEEPTPPENILPEENGDSEQPRQFSWNQTFVEGRKQNLEPNCKTQ